MQLGSLKTFFISGGLSSVAARAFKKFLHPVADVGSVIFTQRDLREPFPRGRAVDGFVGRELFLQDLHLFESVGADYMKTAAERFRQGDRCFAGIHLATGKLANYRWMATIAGYVPEINRYLVLGPGETYLYDLQTLPEFRNRGIDSFVRHYTYSYLQQSGFTWIYGYVRSDNYVSRRAARTLLKQTGRVWYVRPRGAVPWVFGSQNPALPRLEAQPQLQPAPQLEPAPAAVNSFRTTA